MLEDTSTRENALASLPTAKWCIMFYLVGDNNLGDEMVRSLSRVYGSANNRVAIYARFDGPHPMSRTTLLNLQKKTASAARDDYTVEIESEKSASVDSIYDFIVACIGGRPDPKNIFPGTRAEHYALILSGHGDGIQQRTLLLDESPDGSLAISDVATLLGKVKAEILGKELDVLGFDSCLMNSLEVSYQLKDLADLIVASQGNILNAGWDLGSICRTLDRSGAGYDPGQVASLFVDQLRESNRTFAREARRSGDLSICDVSKLREANSVPPDSPMVSSVEDLADSLNYFFDPDGGISKNGDITDEERSFTIELVSRSVQLAHLNCQRFLSEQTVDLYDFCWLIVYELTTAKEMLSWAESSNIIGQLLEFLDNVIQKCDRVMTEIKNDSASLVTYGISSGPDAQYANGVSIFLPWSHMALSLIEQSYNELAFSKSTAGQAWIRFFKNFLRFTVRDRREGGRFFNAPPFYRNAPPFYRGSDVFVDYFRQISNFAIDFPEGTTTDEYPE